MREPKYRFHKGTGLALVEFRGTRHYLGKYGTKESYAAYRKFIDEQVRATAASENAPVMPARNRPLGSVSIAEATEQFLDYAKPYYGKDAGEFRKCRIVAHLLSEHYGLRQMGEFGPLLLKEFRDKHLSTAKRSRGFVNKLVGSVRTFFKWAVSVELVSESDYARLLLVPGLRKGKTPLRESPPVRTVDEDLVSRAVKYMPPQVAMMVKVQRLAAMRPCEVCQLKWEEIVQRDGVWLCKPGTHKNSWRSDTEQYGRVICFGPRAQEILKPLIEESGYVFRPKRTRGGNPTPGKRRPGESYRTGSYREAVIRAIKKANKANEKISHWTPRQIRKNAATAVRNEHGLEAAQVILGHARADVTQVYAERDLAKAIEIARLHG